MRHINSSVKPMLSEVFHFSPLRLDELITHMEVLK